MVMFTGSSFARDTWPAGVGAVLRKPEALDQICTTITKLLNERKEI